MGAYAVVYWSGTGNTEEMAKAVVEGCGGTLIPCSDFTDSDVAKYDGIAFGCSASGAEVLEEGEFEPMWDSVASSLKDKKVVLFGSYGWGGGAFMDAWKEKADEAGVPLVDTYVCENAPEDEHLEACKALGKALT